MDIGFDYIYIYIYICMYLYISVCKIRQFFENHQKQFIFSLKGLTKATLC